MKENGGNERISYLILILCDKVHKFLGRKSQKVKGNQTERRVFFHKIVIIPILIAAHKLRSGVSNVFFYSLILSSFVLPSFAIRI